MTPEIATCLLVLAAAIACFAWDRIPADAVAIGVMLALVLTGLLKPAEAFAGFGSDVPYSRPERDRDALEKSGAGTSLLDEKRVGSTAGR